MTEKEPQSHLDKDIRGANEVDSEDIQAYLKAVQRAQQPESPTGPEQARAELEEARLRKGSPNASAPRSDNPALRLSDETVETGKRGIAATRDELHPPTSPTEPEASEDNN